MLRSAVLLALVSVAGVVAAPVPPPSEKELLARHWGKTEGQGEFELKGKRLTIRTTVPPDVGLISVIYGGKTTMPRATRTVTGDFEAAVTVTDAALPTRTPSTRTRTRTPAPGCSSPAAGTPSSSTCTSTTRRSTAWRRTRRTGACG